ncbi:hypothetical protein BKA69DRAFT_1077313 [Paraphysoderma sedebokerense]|nr:hypothetical protein BKA69DRAFT_1077313 [Paraphysoderma sedebokerense]
MVASTILLFTISSFLASALASFPQLCDLQAADPCPNKDQSCLKSFLTLDKDGIGECTYTSFPATATECDIFKTDSCQELGDYTCVKSNAWTQDNRGYCMPTYDSALCRGPNNLVCPLGTVCPTKRTRFTYLCVLGSGSTRRSSPQ